MNKDLGQVLYECLSKDDGWPEYWDSLPEISKKTYRDAAFKFAVYVGKKTEDA